MQDIKPIEDDDAFELRYLEATRGLVTFILYN